MIVARASETANMTPANSSANWTVRRALRERKRITSVAAHALPRRRPEPHRKLRRSLGGRERTVDTVARYAQVWVPQGQYDRAVGSVRELHETVGVCLGSPEAVGDEDRRTHLVMDVAA